MSPTVYSHRYISLVQYSKNTYSLPEASCHWLQTCNVSIAMVVVGCTCLLSFIVIQPTIE